MSRILIVEDHQTLLRGLRRGLQSLGHDVLVTDRGEEGFQWALSQNVDALILDVMLGQRNGFEILEDLRGAGFARPVLILTARDTAADRQRAKTAGADGFLAKPFAFAELVRIVGELLQAPSRPPGEPPCHAD